MTITWFGLSSFKIVGKDKTIITDPFGKESGLAPVRGAADIIVCSDPNNPLSNNFTSISGAPFVIAGSGEYDVGGVFVRGVAAESKETPSATIYGLEVDDIRIAFLGFRQPDHLTDAQKEALEGADIVLIPVGSKQVNIATQLEPYFVIPHSYTIPGVVSVNLDKIDKFLQEMGGKRQEMDKLTLKKKDLASETTQLITLIPQR
ncbi:MAG: MBL fold metallo-hydrolase [Candidatus Doudnabacteria bacterium]|nr:MBL fold metallo-hydrolase [Candidatus Doudnabacteria bacterium]